MLRSSHIFFCKQTPKYNPWSVLGVTKGSPKNVLRERYHSLMQQHHPYFVKEGKGDLKKVREIDEAYLWVTKSPTMDKRYKNLITDTGKLYYLLLPKWMAKNLDEMPRYWNWIRWKISNAGFYVFILCLLYVLGRLYPTHHHFVKAIFVTFLADCIFHTAVAPMLLIAMFFRILGEQRHYSLSWLQSPKGFWRRDLDY